MRRGQWSVLGTPAPRSKRATIAVRPRRSATSTGERPSLSLAATLAPRAKSSGTTRSMPAGVRVRVRVRVKVRVRVRVRVRVGVRVRVRVS